VWTGHPIDARNPSYLSDLLQRIHQSGLASQVLMLGLIPRIDQIQLMRRAIAVIQPSLFEGWSTVVEDARALGRPVILSDIAVHQEQDPPGARFFPPASPAVLAEAMEAAWREGVTGPDLAAESEARRKAHEALLGYGERFWNLVAG
jgi:glycosyltransferase involved in cell wall biosynthesis